MPGADQLQGGLLERVPEGCPRGADGIRQGLRVAAEGGAAGDGCYGCGTAGLDASGTLW